MARLASLALLGERPKREFFGALLLAALRPDVQASVGEQALSEASELLPELRGQEWARGLILGPLEATSSHEAPETVLVALCSRLLQQTYYHARFAPRVIAELVLIQGALADWLSEGRHDPGAG